CGDCIQAGERDDQTRSRTDEGFSRSRSYPAYYRPAHWRDIADQGSGYRCHYRLKSLRDDDRRNPRILEKGEYGRDCRGAARRADQAAGWILVPDHDAEQADAERRVCVGTCDGALGARWQDADAAIAGTL